MYVCYNLCVSHTIHAGMIEEVGQSQGSEVEAQQGNKCMYAQKEQLLQLCGYFPLCSYFSGVGRGLGGLRGLEPPILFD